MSKQVKNTISITGIFLLLAVIVFINANLLRIEVGDICQGLTWEEKIVCRQGQEYSDTHQLSNQLFGVGIYLCGGSILSFVMLVIVSTDSIMSKRNKIIISITGIFLSLSVIVFIKSNLLYVEVDYICQGLNMGRKDSL